MINCFAGYLPSSVSSGRYFLEIPNSTFSNFGVSSQPFRGSGGLEFVRAAYSKRKVCHRDVAQINGVILWDNRSDHWK